MLLIPLVRRSFTRHKLRAWSGLVSRIDHWESELQTLSEQQFRKQSLGLKYRALSGEPLTQLLPHAFAMVREAGRRALGMRHYDVQLVGGIAMHFGSVAEMQTGEGKTLTATLPLYLHALCGKGAHLATANDYLAQRDAELMMPLFTLLGLTVGVVQSQTPRPQRALAYQSDITYGTAKEFGFDFLRDRLLRRHSLEHDHSFLQSMLETGPSDPGPLTLQRDRYFILVDEADSILIDEARTPLVVSSLPGASETAATQLYQWCAEIVPQFEDFQDYEFDARQSSVTLTAQGRRKLRKLSHPDAISEISLLEIYEHLQRAILVHRNYQCDRHYVIRDGEIVIVDEFTGRLSEGRKWRSGIHQAIEAKEKLDISVDSGQAARVTMQSFILQYKHVAGMTGTTAQSSTELQKIYRLAVAQVPTHRPSQRVRWQDRVHRDADEKWQAVVDEVQQVHATGRPVLIGTRSIDKSDQLAHYLTQAGIAHQVLNARNHALEADIISQAGQLGKVTVATNMAGRGTDIQLGEGVSELGGLHVICTELHESARIDRQLIGRCGRQGDPGSFRQFLSLDDDILQVGLGGKQAERLRAAGEKDLYALQRLAGKFRQAQRRIERRQFRDRRNLLDQEKQWNQMQWQMGQDPYLDSSL